MTSQSIAFSSQTLRGEAPVLVTGAAGFIGCFVSLRLLELGVRVIGLDNMNAYYEPTLKSDRLALLTGREGFTFEKMDLADAEGIRRIVETHRPSYVIHLAAQAGVRYSIDQPAAYGESNLVGFLNILEACRASPPDHLVYASSSSVYGGNQKLPFSVADSVDHPVSLYAATKKANELMAHSYSHLYGLPATGLRFFTVYGPWGRPDMAYFKFTKAIFEGRPIQIYNHGAMKRDFTYVDDIVEGVLRVTAAPPAANDSFDRAAPHPGRSWAAHRVFNIGNRRQEKLMDMISWLEQAIGIEAEKEFLPMQPGDVEATWADVQDLEDIVGFKPDTPLKNGLEEFVQWYRARYVRKNA